MHLHTSLETRDLLHLPLLRPEQIHDYVFCKKTKSYNSLIASLLGRSFFFRFGGRYILQTTQRLH